MAKSPKRRRSKHVSPRETRREERRAGEKTACPTPSKIEKKPAQSRWPRGIGLRLSGNGVARRPVHGAVLLAPHPPERLRWVVWAKNPKRTLSFPDFSGHTSESNTLTSTLSRICRKGLAGLCPYSPLRTSTVIRLAATTSRKSITHYKGASMGGRPKLIGWASMEKPLRHALKVLYPPKVKLTCPLGTQK